MFTPDSAVSGRDDLSRPATGRPEILPGSAGWAPGPANGSNGLPDISEVLSETRNVPTRPMPAPGGLPGKTTPRRFAVGPVLYLISLGVVATATIGVFFGTGFLLLAQPTGVMISGTGAHHRGIDVEPVIAGVLPASDGSRLPPDSKPGMVAEKMEVLASADAVASTVAPVAPSASPVLSVVQAEPSPTSLTTLTPTALGPALSAAELADLLAQGDARLRLGDIASARLLYERAAEAGDGRAALRLGATFDPTFLGRAGLRNVRGDAAEASSWYSRAVDLGAAEAKHRLERLETKQGR